MIRLVPSMTLALAVAACLAPTTAKAGLIASSSSVSITASADADVSDGSSATDSALDSQGSTLNLLSVDALASDVVGPGPDDPSSITSGYTTLAFTDASNLSVILGTSWVTANVPVGNNYTTQSAVYEFQVSGGDQLLSIAYAVTVGGSFGFGMTNYSMALSSGGLTEKVFIDNLLGEDPFVAGTQEFLLLDGQSYTLTISAHPNISGGLGTIDASGFGVFDISAAAAVPEPSTLALAGLGGLGIGAVVVRRRRTA